MSQSWQVLLGDAREQLRELPDASANCVVTSPPYWGLRDYGTARWDGGDASCDHRKVTDPIAAVATSTLGGGKKSTGHQQEGFHRECGRCGAVRVDTQIGLESSVSGYVTALVSVFDECRRVLREDGCAFLNLGDAYASSPASGGEQSARMTGGAHQHTPRAKYVRPEGLKPKDLVGLPWTVAFALRNAGWWLRAGIVWHKPNGMPESVTDRVTTSHEFVFHLAKSARYWYDASAISEPSIYPDDNRKARASKSDYEDRAVRDGINTMNPLNARTYETRNARSVWTISPEPSSVPHFAMMPKALARKCILAGCPPDGTVLDPFAGAGTTLVVALEEGRNAIGIELNPDYREIARQRCADVAPLLAMEVSHDDQVPS